MSQDPDSRGPYVNGREPGDDVPTYEQSCYPGVRWVNTTTGQIAPFKCRSYRCAKCGPARGRQLYAAISELTARWGYARLWTFTLKRNDGETPSEHRKRLTRAWRYMIVLVRGRGSQNGYAPDLEYVRVTELHDGGGWQHGFRHYHVLVNRYLDARVMIALWKQATDSGGSCHVRGIRAAKTAVRYVVKYVTKTACTDGREPHEPLHTHSHGIRLFRIRTSTGQWCVVRGLVESSCLEPAQRVCDTILWHESHTHDATGPPDIPDKVWTDTDVELTLRDADLARQIMNAIAE